MNKMQGFRVKLQVSGGGRGVTDKGQDRNKTGTRNDKTGTRWTIQGKDRDKSGAKQRKDRDKIREGGG